MARIRARWKTVPPFRPTVAGTKRPPQLLRPRVMELNRGYDLAGDRQRAVFAQELCRQLEGHLLQLIAENDRLEIKLKQSKKTISQLRRGLRGGER